MNSRIQKLLESENLSPSRFAEIIGVQRSSISHILSGRNKPSFDLIHSILLKFPQISPDWLLMGNGSIYRRMVQASLFDAAPKSRENEIRIAEVTPTKKIVEPTENEVDNTILSAFKAPENQKFSKSIERVLIFFSDKTFTEYVPGV